jgi:hypothetical protein
MQVGLKANAESIFSYLVDKRAGQNRTIKIINKSLENVEKFYI